MLFLQYIFTFIVWANDNDDISSENILNILKSEPEFLNVYGAQESIPRNEFHQPM
jgi:hypothetical protein